MQWNMIEDDANDGVDKIIAYSNHRWKGVEDINVKVIPRVFLVWLEPWHGGKPKDPTNPDDLTGWHWPKGIDPEKVLINRNRTPWRLCRRKDKIPY